MQIVKIRASSLSRMLDCAHSWEGVHLKGMWMPSSPAATVGSSVHYSTAAFDAGILDGSGLTADETAAFAVDYLREHRGETDWWGMNLRQAEALSIRVHHDYCTEMAPKFNFIAVEEKLRPMTIAMSNSLAFELTGTLDRINDYGDLQAGVIDEKTGRNAVTVNEEGTHVAVTRSHGPQTGVYHILGEGWLEEHLPKYTMSHEPGIIGLQTTNNARMGFGLVRNARAQVLGFANQPGFLEFVAQYFETGLFPPNPQSWICGAKYCPRYTTCNFHG